MARISSVSSALEAYYKLTQSQLTENEIKKELSKETHRVYLRDFIINKIIFILQYDKL